ncbi:MAG: PAS domain-containing protein [Candidatus Hydrogenedentes bacterium]|nr:PAS domain-containing protein [Candidatus Hydrogenedentota bacterium]
MADTRPRTKATRASTTRKKPHSIAEQALASLTSGVIAMDADGVVLYANNAATLFLGMRLPVGTRLSDLPAVSPLLEVVREIMDSRSPVSRREVHIVTLDGARKEIGLSASLLEGPSDFNGVILLFTDMTERRALERSAELNRQLAQIGELTAGVVHELRNPVSVVSGMSELLLRKLEAGDDRRDIADAIFQEARNLEESIAQFLGFARPFELELSYCTPDAIVRRATQLCQRQAEKKPARLEAIIEDDLPEMRADLSRAAQAIANLISNAIDAVNPDGWVQVSARRDDSSIVFEVMDNGPGIHLNPNEDLFSPFFTKKESGTGLGLSIVHRVITAHGGTVSYVNRPEGGACFTVRLPIEREALA